MAARLPIGHYKPNSAAAKATAAVTVELLERCAALEGGTESAADRRVA